MAVGSAGQVCVVLGERLANTAQQVPSRRVGYVRCTPAG